MFFSLMKNKRRISTLDLLLIPLVITSALTSATVIADVNKNEVLTFERAITLAKKNDPWLVGNQHKQNALLALSRVAETLPDPKMSLAIANLPTNGFDFSQEAMTQFKVGITQVFPRGDTLAIKNQQLKLQSQAYPFQRLDRQAKVEVTVGSLWLDAYRVQQSIALIKSNRVLFEQLVDVAQASYSSAVGKTRQQDIVRAQLELTRLDDQLEILGQQKNSFEGQLFQWLNSYTNNESILNNQAENFVLHGLDFGDKLVEVQLKQSKLIYANQWEKPEQLVKYFAQHPSVMAMDKKIGATKTGINLAKQKYKSEWGVNASYGYRDDDPLGHSRADFMSVGVTFDLPLFTENKQDQEVKSAVYQTEAIKTEKILLLRQLLGAYSSGKGRLSRLNARKELYRHKLLPQTQDQAEATLTAYTNDNGNFSEVVRATIAVLNAEIDQLTINVEQQKIILELNYLFVGGFPSSQNKTAINGASK